MPQIGADGQERLSRARVTVVGAGGLGSPVLTYLACAGVGHIRIVDSDVVEETNLNRQFLYGAGAIGMNKAKLACTRLGADCPDIAFEPVCARITPQNVDELLGSPDVLVDCVNTIESRLVVNAFAMRADIPLVEAGVAGFGGFVMSVRRECACLECVLPPLKIKEPQSPVIGAAAGVIGSMQAVECLKILLGRGKPLYGKMLRYDGLQCRFTQVSLRVSESCTQPHCPYDAAQNE